MELITIKKCRLLKKAGIKSLCQKGQLTKTIFLNPRHIMAINTHRVVLYELLNSYVILELIIV